MERSETQSENALDVRLKVGAFSRHTGIPVSTLRRWALSGYLIPGVRQRPNPLYLMSQVVPARKLHTQNRLTK